MLFRTILNPSATVLRHVRRHFSAQQAIKEFCKPIDPQAFIKIRSCWHLRIRPYDLLDCQDGNLLRATLVPINPNVAEIDASSYKLDMVGSANRISVESGLAEGVSGADDVLCILEVPIKSNLTIRGDQDVDVQGLGGVMVDIESIGDIRTKNMQQAQMLKLESKAGSITCDGNLLAEEISLRVYGDNNIDINKAQGDKLEAICETGKIRTQSCYIEQSKFIAIQGHLDLKNVHKGSDIYLPDGGSLSVTGFYGTLNARTRGGEINFQLTELYGESSIQADSPQSLVVNISEFVEEHTCIHASASHLALDETLGYLNDKINKSGDFEIGNNNILEDKLRIISNGVLHIGKLSWLESLKFNTK